MLVPHSDKKHPVLSLSAPSRPRMEQSSLPPTALGVLHQMHGCLSKARIDLFGEPEVLLSSPILCPILLLAVDLLSVEGYQWMVVKFH